MNNVYFLYLNNFIIFFVFRYCCMWFLDVNLIITLQEFLFVPCIWFSDVILDFQCMERTRSGQEWQIRLMPTSTNGQK